MVGAAIAVRAGIACGGSDGSSDVNGGDETEAGLGEAGAGDDGSNSVQPGNDSGSNPPGPDAAPPPPPSYCSGITFYASFDNGTAADLGAAAARATGSAGSSPGHFGEALSVVVDAGADGAAVFYDQADSGKDGGDDIYSVKEGTIAYWFRRDGARLGPVSAYVRPLVSATILTAAGPAIEDQSNMFGLARDLGSTPILFLSRGPMAPYLHAADFDHFAAGWRQGIDGGDGLALVAINGGLGEVLADAGPDSSGLGPFDASPDDAGNVSLPYLVERVVALAPFAGPFGTLRLGGTSVTSPDGLFDDFAVWNRVLSLDEIGELYRRQESIRDACKLP